MSAEAAARIEEARGWYDPSEQPTPSRAMTILLVEDDTFVREVTREVLQAAGYRVLAAKNSVEGLRMHGGHNHKIDLLITDIVLPDENGRALAEKLRKQDPKMRVLFVTGYGKQMELGEEDRLECLAKPFSSGILLDHVQQMLH
jgi:two-component system, cell cycle sensor histidine kinase and response regulator CckA